MWSQILETSGSPQYNEEEEGLCVIISEIKER
jgi:hypothetical protein